ncbi:methyl-accepting chemotaxis protein [Desulfococcaceae bacterium HSG8]|nr:methyl-accepting chemotaxis protein [Desulfococcaceae bacterium HSG8]
MIMMRNNISVRYIKWIIPILSALMLASGVMFYYQKRAHVIEENKRLCEIASTQVGATLKSWINDQIRMTKMIAREPFVIEACANPKNTELVSKAQAFVRRIHEQYPYYEYIQLAVKLKKDETIKITAEGKQKTIRDGQFFVDTVNGKTIGKAGTDFSFIKAGFEGKEYFISEVYPSFSGGNPIFAISVPVEKDDEIRGTAIVALQMSYFTELFVNSIQIGKTGYLTFVDDRGMVISHPNKGYILDKEFSEKTRYISSRAFSGERDFDAVFEGIQKKYIVRKIDLPSSFMQHEWYIATVQEKDEIMQSAAEFFKILIVAGLISFLTISIALVLITKFVFITPIMSVADVAHQLADFDLTVEIDTSRKDEIGMMMMAVHKMLLEFRKIVSDVKSKGVRLTTAADQMTENIGTVASAAEEISLNVMRVSETANQMLQSNTTVASAVEEMTASMNEVGENARRGSGIAEDAVKMAGKAGDTMASLGEAANEIGEVTEVIKRIADKTTLLALNADIEAASAGEAGRGFAVVANEIKEFARQSTQAADDIAARISDVQEKTGQAVKVIGDVSGIINKINLSSENISFVLEEQMRAANEIAASALQADSRANDIAISMGELAGGINEVSISVGRVARGEEHEIKYNLADTSHMDTSATEVARLARELLELVKKFSVDKSEREKS